MLVGSIACQPMNVSSSDYLAGLFGIWNEREAGDSKWSQFTFVLLSLLDVRNKRWFRFLFV